MIIPINNFLQVKMIEEVVEAGGLVSTSDATEITSQKAEVLAVSQSYKRWPQHYPPMQLEPGQWVLIRKGAGVSYQDMKFIKQEDVISIL